ncbi:hypothetical protein [Hymenobacter arizonensis]|uniref:Uncharacterized protein n=1 Tax=Hymenobacter arizonensis TaxID=1227077 RepID=A0A1I6BQ94_HYMAR|nr:hypothetical protein [Hymenobacter arizonensis]SFQ83089.1 hypothetical protein SAMN04515668_4905 [Hymenobacter arizonensis]
MPYYLPFHAPPAGVRLPYHRATASQRTLAVSYLQQRLITHFPTLRASSWPQALADHQPDLWLRGSTVALAETDLTQLAQHLAAAPELPVLDPPLYGLPALHLAQHSLQTRELAVWALVEVVAKAIACGPRLYALLRRLAHPSPLAEQVVQAWCWNLASAPPLIPDIPGSPPLPDSAEVEHLLGCLKSSGTPCTGNLPGPCPHLREFVSLAADQPSCGPRTESLLPGRYSAAVCGGTENCISSLSGISSPWAREASTSSVTE